MSSSLYHQYEHAADAIMNRTQHKTDIIKKLVDFPDITNHFYINAPSGAGSFSFAKSCLAAAGYTNILVFDALDIETDLMDNGQVSGRGIYQSLYTKTKKTAYIYKDGANTNGSKCHTPAFFLGHSYSAEPQCNTIHLFLPTQSQFEQLFYLYTGDLEIGRTEIARILELNPTFGHLHNLMHFVLLYRKNIQQFIALLEYFSGTTEIKIEPGKNGQENEHFFSESCVSTLFQKYVQSSTMPTIEYLYTQWPLYTTNVWRLILPQYASISRMFTIPYKIPIDLCVSYMAHLFHKIPGRGKCHIRDEYKSYLKTPLLNMNSVILYSVYSFQTPREELEYLFRRIYNSYFHIFKSDKNKITVRTKKIGLEKARKEIFRESSSWNEKIYRKWIYYIAQLTL